MSSIGLASLWSDRKATKRASYWYRFVTPASAFDRANVDRIFQDLFCDEARRHGDGPFDLPVYFGIARRTDLGCEKCGRPRFDHPFRAAHRHGADR
jgi:hypothetical protein